MSEDSNSDDDKSAEDSRSRLEQIVRILKVDPFEFAVTRAGSVSKPNARNVRAFAESLDGHRFIANLLSIHDETMRLRLMELVRVLGSAA